MAASSHSTRSRKRKPRPRKLDENYGLSASVALACSAWLKKRGIGDSYFCLNPDRSKANSKEAK